MALDLEAEFKNSARQVARRMNLVMRAASIGSGRSDKDNSNSSNNNCCRKSEQQVFLFALEEAFQDSS